MSLLYMDFIANLFGYKTDSYQEEEMNFQGVPLSLASQFGGSNHDDDHEDDGTLEQFGGARRRRFSQGFA